MTKDEIKSLVHEETVCNFPSFTVSMHDCVEGFSSFLYIQSVDAISIELIVLDAPMKEIHSIISECVQRYNSIMLMGTS